MSDNIAVLDGFTDEYLATNDRGADLHILARPGTDLDDCFRAWCCDEQEFIRVNGWLYTFEMIL